MLNILNYIETHFGWKYRHFLLQNYQMNESMLQNPDAPINLRLSVDICRWLKKNIYRPNVLSDIGKYSVETNRNSVIGKTLSQSRNLQELFELMINELIEKHIEKNFSWKIERLSADGCILQGIPDLNVIGFLGKGYAYDSTVCMIREGFASSIPMYLDYESAPVKRLSCVSQGDQITRFQLDFTSIVRKKKRDLNLIQI